MLKKYMVGVESHTVVWVMAMDEMEAANKVQEDIDTAQEHADAGIVNDFLTNAFIKYESIKEIKTT